jgi:hypothetical protein
MCTHTKKVVEKKRLFSFVSKKRVLTLHRYPENNLFTLKKLIPIEDKSDQL